MYSIIYNRLCVRIELGVKRRVTEIYNSHIIKFFSTSPRESWQEFILPNKKRVVQFEVCLKLYDFEDALFKKNIQSSSFRNLF